MKDCVLIDDHLHETVRHIFGFDFPVLSCLKPEWTGATSDTVENAARLYIKRENFELMAWESRAARHARLQWIDHLADTAAVAAVEADSINAGVIANRFLIDRVSTTEIPADGDLVLAKINHGFWEQLFLISHDGYLPHIVRPTARRGYMNAYLDSRFFDSLVLLARKRAKVAQDELTFHGIDLGISFGSGDHWHDDLIDRIPRLDYEALRIVKGVHAGLTVFLSQMLPASRARFLDGAFAKQGLTNGILVSLLHDVAAKVDHLTFVVPGHLAGVRLVGLPPERQQVLHVSARFVHQAWPLMLAGVARPLLARLAAGEHVGVIVQAAVFSTLLPLYLVHAKTGLGLPGRLTFIDLGQALDLLTPRSGGSWINKKGSGFLSGVNDIPLTITSQRRG